MCLIFESRASAVIYSKKLIDHQGEDKLKPFVRHIDDFFACGLTLRFHPNYEASYWNFSSDFTHAVDFFKCGDPNLLVIIFKGLVICEFNILDNRVNSVSPVNFLHSILKKKLSVAIYKEIIDWTLNYPANNQYRKTMRPFMINSILGRRYQGCSSCAVVSKITLEEAELTHPEYQTIVQEQQNKEYFEKNCCPKCKKYQLNTSQTRWGKVQVCSNYPICDFSKKLDDELF